MDFKINQQERDALKGLPHLARLIYLEAIRPYMDYSTGIVGIRRGISYQSMREELYVEPHRGYVSGSPSKDQMRRGVKSLERGGLVSNQSEGKRLILKCELATWDYSAQNKVATKAPQEVSSVASSKNSDGTTRYGDYLQKADTAELAKAATPPVSDNNYIFVCESFEKFWQLYPNKQSKQKASEIFRDLSPTENLFQKIIAGLTAQCMYRKNAAAHGQWVPNWKNANNWLMQHCWEDELPEQQVILGEKNNACSQTPHKPKSKNNDAMWEFCRDAFAEELESESNIISLSQFKQRQCAVL